MKVTREVRFYEGIAHVYFRVGGENLIFTESGVRMHPTPFLAQYPSVSERELSDFMSLPLPGKGMKVNRFYSCFVIETGGKYKEVLKGLTSTVLSEVKRAVDFCGTVEMSRRYKEWTWEKSCWEVSASTVRRERREDGE